MRLHIRILMKELRRGCFIVIKLWMFVLIICLKNYEGKTKNKYKIKTKNIMYFLYSFI
jgi:translation elongation factor P/translation initiation factor 5A